jgi:hypothetical protein
MEIKNSTTMAKLQDIWSSEIGGFVMSKASGRFTESYLADDFKKDFETLVDENLNNILKRMTGINQLNFEKNNEYFKLIFNSLYQSNEVQVIYLLNELAFTKSAAAIQMLNQSSSSESQPRGMYDASYVDKTVLMFLH